MKTHYRLSLIATFSNDFWIVGNYRNNTRLNVYAKKSKNPVLYIKKFKVALGISQQFYVILYR